MNADEFKALFLPLHARLYRTAYALLWNAQDAEDIVQDVFFKLWRKRETLEIEGSVKVYLLRAARNGCLDCIRHSKVVNVHQENAVKDSVPEVYDTDDYIMYSDLKGHLGAILRQMDAKAAEAFRMNRFDHLKYKEIAEKLNVSERTVEVRIGNALKAIRTGISALKLDK